MLNSLSVVKIIFLTEECWEAKHVENNFLSSIHKSKIFWSLNNAVSQKKSKTKTNKGRTDEIKGTQACWLHS